MRAVRRFLRRLAASLPGRRDDDRVREELAEHLALLTEEYARGGLPLDDARRRAKLTLGTFDAATEAYRDQQRLRLLEDTWQDVRYALRMLRKAPTFAATIILTLALGIGANTAIFSLFEAIQLRTLPVSSGDDLYFVAHGSRRAAPSSNYPYFERIRARTDLFAGATAYLKGATVKVSAGDRLENARAHFVSHNYHAVLGVPIALGQGFTAAGDRPGATPLEAVISDGYWARQFGRDPRIVGRTVTVDTRRVTVVGVTAAGFDGLDPGARVDLALPLAMKALDSPGFLMDHQTWMGDMPVVVRLRSGVESVRAAAAIDVLLQGFISEPDNSWLRTMAGGTAFARRCSRPIGGRLPYGINTRMRFGC